MEEQIGAESQTVNSDVPLRSVDEFKKGSTISSTLVDMNNSEENIEHSQDIKLHNLNFTL